MSTTKKEGKKKGKNEEKKSEGFTGPSSEGLHTFEDANKRKIPVDRRDIIEFSETYLLSHRMLQQIESFFIHPSDLCSRKRGSGSSVPFLGKDYLISRKSGLEGILTCAHNVTIVNFELGLRKEADRVEAFEAREGDSKWKSKRLIKPMYSHPKYNGDPQCGYDFAVGLLAKQLGSKNCNTGTYSATPEFEDVRFAFGGVEPDSLEVGMEVSVAGYPGEKSNEPHEHTAKITKIHRTRLGGWTIYYDVDTTKGNSGSPIMLQDTEWIKTEYPNQPNLTKVVIGVHTGSDAFLGWNFGTLITEDIVKWMSNKMSPHINKKRHTHPKMKKTKKEEKR